MLHRDLTAARFLPALSLGPRVLRLVRRIPVPAAKVPAGLDVEDIHADGPAGKLRVRLYRPATLSRPAPVLLWFHGGGYVMGVPEQDDRTCQAMADRLAMTVASVDYRLAPEHPFPAALDDAHAALHWLLDHSTQRHVDTARIAVGGASAGGGLAAAFAQRVHDEGEVVLAFQLLVYPMLDDRTVSRNTPAPRDLRVWTPESNRFGWSSYLATTPGGRQVPPYSVPARREHLAGLPPAWIGVGSEDLFHDEDSDYARRLTADGVPTRLEVIPGACHGFDALFPRKDVSRRFLDDQIDALSTALLPGA
ncbi:MAG: alpha/beta hydrolase [Candidatus Nanopelagicales bacterium]